MKNFGSFLEFTQQRNNELLSIFDSVLPSVKSVADAFSIIANSPSSRFWVSEERAAIVIADMLKKRPLRNMRPLKQQMFQEIFHRFLILRQQNPSAPLRLLVSQVIHQPAPSFYLSPRSIGEIIYLIHKGWYDKRSQNSDNKNFKRKS